MPKYAASHGLLAALFLLLTPPVHASADALPPAFPQPGEQTKADIAWSRTTEPSGAKCLPVAAWRWIDLESINADETNNVWDGGRIGNHYIKDASRSWDIAT